MSEESKEKDWLEHMDNAQRQEYEQSKSRLAQIFNNDPDAIRQADIKATRRLQEEKNRQITELTHHKSQSEGLKPCPLCGSTDISGHDWGYAKHYIVCNTCECSTGYMLDDDEAIEAWNTRPLEDALIAERDLLQKQLEEYSKFTISNELVVTKSDYDDLQAKLEESVDIIRNLLNNLPDSFHPLNESWEDCWWELVGQGQEDVKVIRKVAEDFLAKIAKLGEKK